MLLPRRACARIARRGSALLLAFLVLILLAAILFQLYIGTSTDARVARNEVTLTSMNQAIESALLEEYDKLLQDAEAGEAASSAGSAGGASTGGAAMGDGMASPEGAQPQAPAGGESSQSVDSHEDSWGRPQRTTINEIEMRVMVQDEDSKINVLSMLTENEDEAEKALERVVRVLDLCRADSSADLDRSDARRLAEAMRDHMKHRSSSPLPSATRLSLVDDDVERELPFSLREMLVLEPFDTGLFRDFRDERGQIVHSIGSFLTVWTSLKPLSEIPPPPGSPAANQQAQANDQQGGSGSGNQGNGNDNGNGQQNGGQGGDQQGGDQQAEGGQGGSGSGPGSGGIAVNINTAPAAVLKSLMDDRDVDYRFWDEVIEYRNLEEKSETGDDTEREPVYDEYGQEIYPHQVFDSLAELEELRSWDRIQAEQRAELSRLIGTQSQVFSIFVTARRATGRGDAFGGTRGALPQGQREDERGDAIVTTVRSVVWRYKDGETWKIVPIVRWEVLDYTPFEVLDFPPDDR
jgi:hypothetical protein